MNNRCLDKTARTLLQLLNIAINGRVQSLESDVNWSSVLKLAQQQGVRGVAYEALELLKCEGSDRKSVV